MPSESTGKKYTIKSIKYNKDNVTLTFIKHERVQISKDAYLSTYLYEGKGLSKKEIDKLIELSAYAELSNYALKLLNKRRYSEKAFYEKLKAKDNNKEIINAIIKKYKKNGLLDDKSFMEDLIAWDDERLFGKNKILKHLKDEGIPEALISKVHFSSSNELKKAKGLLPKLDKKYAKYAYQSKKRHIFDALINQGYEIDVAKKGYTFSSTKVDVGKTNKTQKLNIKLDLLTKNTKMTFNNITFETNSAELNAESFKELNRLIEFMKLNDNVRIELSAHTDDVGPDWYNMILSQKRAQVAVKYLKEKGVKESAIVAKGYGELHPIVPNNSDANRAQNRRIEVKIIDRK